MHEERNEVRREVTVDTSVEEAFRAFTERLEVWWPPSFTFGGEAFEAAAVEPKEGGRWFERGRDGREVDWGEVRAWDPPQRVVLSWRVSPARRQEPPERASEVEVAFRPAGAARTRVELVHRDFARHGEGAEAMRAGMASEQGWTGLLASYRREVE